MEDPDLRSPGQLLITVHRNSIVEEAKCRGSHSSSEEYVCMAFQSRLCPIMDHSTHAMHSQFAKEYQFQHVPSSPLYPEGNGKAEHAVKTIKRLLKKGDDLYLALLSYRATPLSIGYSPSELLMSWKLRTTVPTTREQLVPRTPDREVHKQDKQRKQSQERAFNDQHRA